MKLILGVAGFPDGWIKPDDVLNVDAKAVVDLMFPSEVQLLGDCNGENVRVRLFNLTADPTEHFDVAGDHPDLVAEMRERLQLYVDSAIPPNVAPEVVEGNPAKYDKGQPDENKN